MSNMDKTPVPATRSELGLGDPPKDTPPPPVSNPYIIEIPGNPLLHIWATSNAHWEQRLTVTISQTPPGGGPPQPTTYVFSGTGEGIPMGLADKRKDLFLESDPANHSRTCNILCEYNKGTGWLSSAVFAGPPSLFVELGSTKIEHWTVYSEDGGDTDINDSMLEIEASNFF